MNAFNLFGDIVASDADRWFDSDVTPAMFLGWLSKQEGDIEVNINSNGGDVAAGLAIANAIRGYDKGAVTANVLGLAASMASVVACAADRLTVGKGAFVMIHNPWGVATGDAGELRHTADVLDQMKASLLAFYASKFDRSADELAALMDDETWIPGDEAAAFGLRAEPYADEFRAAACLTHRAFAKAPESARALFTVKARELNAPTQPTPEPGDWEGRYKGLMKKFNEVNAAHAAECERLSAAYKADLAAAVERHQAAINDFKAQLDSVRCDLDKAKAELSGATERAESAERELAAKGEQLDRLTKSQALLTAGVLSPSAAPSYDEQIAAARNARERESIRRRKASGKRN